MSLKEKPAVNERTKFATRYTAADLNLLAYVDKALGNFSGPAPNPRTGIQRLRATGLCPPSRRCRDLSDKGSYRRNICMLV